MRFQPDCVLCHGTGIFPVNTLEGEQEECPCGIETPPDNWARMLLLEVASTFGLIVLILAVAMWPK